MNIKRRIIPAKPRSKELYWERGKGGGTTVVGGDNNVSGSPRIEILTTDSLEELDDENVLSSLRSLKEIEEAIDKAKLEIATKYLRKDIEDTAQEKITFNKGLKSNGTIETNKIEGITAEFNEIQSNIIRALVKAEIKELILKDKMSSESFLSGFAGYGFQLKENEGRWTLEVDDLIVRKTMNIYELVVQRISHLGGQVILSGSGGEITNVENKGSYWYIEHDGVTDFSKGSQILCQNFKVGEQSSASVKRYWRLVTDAGKGWINLSKTDMETGSAEPEIGDEIVEFGHRTDINRQNAIVLAGAGSDSPYIQSFKGINSYSTLNKDLVNIGNEVKFKVNKFEVLSGDTYYQVPAERGAFDKNTVYRYYDRVSHNGSIWLYISHTETSNNEPTENSDYWFKEVSRGLEIDVSLTEPVSILSTPSNGVASQEVIDTAKGLFKVVVDGEDVTGTSRVKYHLESIESDIVELVDGNLVDSKNNFTIIDNENNIITLTSNKATVEINKNTGKYKLLSIGNEVNKLSVNFFVEINTDNKISNRTLQWVITKNKDGEKGEDGNETKALQIYIDKANTSYKEAQEVASKVKARLEEMDSSGTATERDNIDTYLTDINNKKTALINYITPLMDDNIILTATHRATITSREGDFATALATFYSYIDNLSFAHIKITKDRITSEVHSINSNLQENYSTIDQTNTQISLKVGEEMDGVKDSLLDTGVDITNKEINVTADKFKVQNNDGVPIAMFDGTGDVPKLKAEHIEFDNATGTNVNLSGTINADKGYFGKWDILGSVISSKDRLLELNSETNQITIKSPDTGEASVVVSSKKLPSTVASYFPPTETNSVNIGTLSGTIPEAGKFINIKTIGFGDTYSYLVRVPSITLSASVPGVLPGMFVRRSAATLGLFRNGQLVEILDTISVLNTTNKTVSQSKDTGETKASFSGYGVWSVGVIEEFKAFGGNGSVGNTAGKNVTVNRTVTVSEIGSNGMVIATDRQNYIYMVEDLLELSLGGNGIRFTDDGVYAKRRGAWFKIDFYGIRDTGQNN